MSAIPQFDAPALNVQKIRAEFPALARKVHGKPLIYFDNAASAQRPAAVIAATTDYYRNHNANIHRGVHTLSQEATELFEAARDEMTRFIGARDRKELIFTRGATEGINLVAQAFARPLLKPGDEVLITHLEHHSNIVPWQLVCEQTGATLRVIPMLDNGELDLDAFGSMLSPRVKMLAMIYVSNSLGTINPLKEMVSQAHEYDIPVLVDGAQSTPHMAIDVQALDCDFYCIAGHKMFGPTGIGILYGKENLLEAMPPYHGGGEMIKTVTFEKTTYNDLPAKFEAGTPNIAGGIGLGAAARYLTAIGMDNIERYEATLLEHATRRLTELDGVTIVGTARDKAAVVSFTVDGVHPQDLGTILDHHGVAIRTGHHCTMPIMQYFGLPGTSRASMAFYNTIEEIDIFVDALEKSRAMLA